MGLITEYKCPACGAPLAFDADSGKVKCDNCGKDFTAEKLIDAQDNGAQTTEFDWGDYKRTLNREAMTGTLVYKCQSCGAELETDENTASVTCPYCNNNVVITERVSGGLKPNYVIPFAFTKKELPEKLNAFFGNKKYLPDNFINDNVVGKATGIYVPFWLFDCEVGGRVNYNATRSNVINTPKETITETSFYLLQREGTMTFENVPVDASVRMDNDLMDSIEPYDYSKMIPFEEAYLSGYVADRFDSDPDAELPRANKRTIQSTLDAMNGTTGGFLSVTQRSNSLKLNRADVKYALLPVYVLNCEYEGKTYRYAINGQTGKVVGELPVCKKKINKKFFANFGIAAAISFVGLSLLSMFLGGYL